MGRKLIFILSAVILMMLSHVARAKVKVTLSQFTPNQSSVNANHGVPASIGIMYEVGKYPGRHKQFMHKKLVNPAPAAINANLWVLQPDIPTFTVYYFSSLYRSHISAILNSNDLLRGPPVALA